MPLPRSSCSFGLTYTWLMVRAFLGCEATDEVDESSSELLSGLFDLENGTDQEALP
jgi:hypothetical protein